MKALLAFDRKLLGELLQERDLLSDEDLNNALSLQAERSDRIGKILTDLGFVSERDVLSVLSGQIDVPLFTGEYPAVPIEAEKLPYRFLRSFKVLPVHLADDVLSLVMADPLDSETQSAIRLRTNYGQRVYLAPASDVIAQLDRLYGEEGGDAHV